MYCSKECFDNWQRRNQTIKHCTNCNKEIIIKTTQRKNNKNYFCNKQCEFEWKKGKNHPRYNRKMINCDYCNKEYEIKNYLLKKHTNHFCSFECEQNWMKENWREEGHPRWKGGINLYYDVTSKEWRNKRLEILSRDKFTCQYCGKKLDECDNLLFDIHHIIPYRLSQSNNSRNLITLCRKCHLSIVEPNWREFASKWYLYNIWPIEREVQG